MLKRPSKYTRFVLPIKEQLILYRTFSLEIKVGWFFFLLQPSAVFSVEAMSVTDQADSTSGSSSPLSLRGQLQKGKKRRNKEKEYRELFLVGMEVQGRTGKISK